MNRAQRVLAVIGLFMVLAGLAWNVIPAKQACDTVPFVSAVKRPSQSWAEAHAVPPRSISMNWGG